MISDWVLMEGRTWDLVATPRNRRCSRGGGSDGICQGKSGEKVLDFASEREDAMFFRVIHVHTLPKPVA